MSPALLLKTDQTGCYDAHGQDVPCAGSGQDGETNFTQADQAARFDIQDKVVTDRKTGLTWSRSASPAEFPITWAEAFQYTTELNRQDCRRIHNWRLPTRRELFSLISHQQINPALPEGHPFMDVTPVYYWTASKCKRLTDQAWYIHLGGGRIYRGMQHGSYMLWPVAGPQTETRPITDRFEFENLTFLDRLTKRMWLKQTEVMMQPVNWEKALETVNTLNAQKTGGHIDWRLPNIRELESLVDLNRHSPALSPKQLFNDIAQGYWSSTTSVYEKRYAWVLYPQDGAVGVGYKPLPEFHVWAVRTHTV